MDDGLETGFYVAAGTAAAAGGAALLLDAAAVYGISQIGAVSLSNLPAQVLLEYRLITAATPGAVGLKDYLNRTVGMSTGEAAQFFGWIGRTVTKTPSQFTQAELLSKGFTQPVLQSVAWIYQRVAILTPTNPSAVSRAEQMEQIIKSIF